MVGMIKGTKMQTYYVLKQAGGWKGTFSNKSLALKELKKRKKWLKSKNHSAANLLSIEEIKRKRGSR